jgi:Holliday junction resolvasome RuvABC endonuclease subunit
VTFVAGIDYDSSAIHAVLIDETTHAFLHHRAYDLASGPGDAFDRARRVRDLLPARGNWHDIGVLAVGIELPFTRQLNSLVALTRVQGAILACLPRDLMVVDVRPQTWKADTLGQSNATKEQVRDWAIARGCPPGLALDFYDAYAIAVSTATRWAQAQPTAA